MSFVFPALFGAAVLAGIPVLLHLILRQKPKTLPFPAFRFLVPRHKTNQRKLQLRHWLLLALRMLLIAGLIAALARPRLMQNNLGLGRDRPVAAVLVIDVSPSMDARSTDSRSRLDDAKKQALGLLDELPDGSRVAVLSSTDGRGDWAGNLFQARQRIQNMKIQPTSPPLSGALSTPDRKSAIVAAIRLFQEIAGKRDDEPGTRLPRLLCVFSDSTVGCWDAKESPRVIELSDQVPVPRETLLEARSDVAAVLARVKDNAGFKEALAELQGARLTPADFPLDGRPLQILQQVRATARELVRTTEDKDAAAELRKLIGHLTGYQTMWFDVGLDPPRDVAVLDIEWPPLPGGAPRESLRPTERLPVTPVLQALGQDFQVALTVGNAKEIREVKKGERMLVPFDLEQVTPKLGPGFHGIEFAVNVRDAFAGDNQRYATFAMRPSRRGLGDVGKALLVSDSADAKDEDLGRALLAHDLPFDVRTPESLEAAGIPAEYQTVFVDAVKNPTGKLWQRLGERAKAGGQIVIIPGGDEMNVKAYGEDAKDVLPAMYSEAVDVRKSDEKGTRWDFTDQAVFRHPLIQPFEAWLNNPLIPFKDNPPRVWKFWDTKNAAKEHVVIRYLDDSRPAMLERKIGSGKVLQLTTPLALRTPAWNNYLEVSNHFYITITGQLVRYVAGELEPMRLNFLLGREEASLPTRGLVRRGPLTLVGPESGPIAFDEALPRLVLPQANQPGNYQVQDAKKATLAAFSMNYAPEEVDLSPWPVADMENIFGAGVRIAPDRTANVRELLKGHWSEPVELFPFFMLALLVLLAAENLIANRFYRREDAGGGAA